MSKFKKPSDGTIPQLEAETLKFWQDNKIFEKSVEQRSEDNRYVFYDGPPFISGLPHYGHLLGSIAKDIVPRYWTMKGKRVERVWGWDAHGLTVENKVQAKLGIKNRRDIISYGLEKFIKECYVYTSEVSAEWNWYIDKIGRWVDMEHAYKTTDQSYMESVIWAFKQLYDKGLIYTGVYTSLYCTTCGTPVSNFEITMDNTYKDYEDQAITVKFPITNEGKFKGVNVLAWTTTPWTIPSNRALVVLEEADYVLVEEEGQKFIVASARLDPVFEGKKFKILKTIKGKELLGLTYEAPYDFYASKPNEYKVYSYEGMVTTQEGTGVVHSAPGFGEIDTEMGRHYGLTLMLSIDEEGKFVPGNNGHNPFEKQFYTKANSVIISDLQEKGYLFKSEKIAHRVPYHDRCDTVLIQRAQNSWFVDVKKLKARMLETNKNINWVPDHLKEGRFAIGVAQAPDWCISRTRFWATPMPVWMAEDGDIIVVGSIKELEKLSGKKIIDLHRPYIDEVVINKNGKSYTRIPEVLDSWFEAGSMPYAQMHYPMENQKQFEKNFPGDYIIEYIAQTRAWFFFMHVLSVALFEANSFKNVISTGVMAGADGRKMSKTYGNYTDPKAVLETIGGDALRLYLMSSPLMLGENANFDIEELRTKSKNVLNPLWNSLKFFTLYAEQNGWEYQKYEGSPNLLDRWIVVRLNQFIQQFSENMEAYLIPNAVTLIDGFVDDLSRWYVRRSRDRISGGDSQAMATLYYVLVTFAKASAPAIPFMAEQIHQSLRQEGYAESVHLSDYPSAQTSDEDADSLIENMRLVREIVSLGHEARSQGNQPVRQPLKAIKILNLGDHVDLQEYYFLLKAELNVKEITYVENPTDLGDAPGSANWLVVEAKRFKIELCIELNAELKLEGNKRLFERTVQGLRKQNGFSTTSTATVYYPSNFVVTVSVHGEEIKSKVNASKLIESEKNIFEIKPD